jgi:hypothetical protein
MQAAAVGQPPVVRHLRVVEAICMHQLRWIAPAGRLVATRDASSRSTHAATPSGACKDAQPMEEET